MKNVVLNPEIFRAYDIRGVVPSELNAEGVRRIVHGIFGHLKPKTAQVGMDMRITGPEFKKVLIEELTLLGGKYSRPGFNLYRHALLCCRKI